MFPQTVFPETARINEDDQLLIGGCNTLEVADQFGTPVYVVDEQTLRAHCRSFVREF